MDTLTHAVIGALAVKVPRREFFTAGSGLSETGRMTVVAAASIFPDLDYIGFGIDPYQFITHWHRGLSHSLLMLPLWAVILGMLFAAVARRSDRRREITWLCALGLGLHIAVDSLTLYGTQLLSPLFFKRVALGLTFDVDIWVAVIAACGLISSAIRRNFARFSLVVLTLYLGFCALAQFHARRVVELSGPADVSGVVHILPHPLSPWHRRLIMETDRGYWIAFLNISGRSSWLTQVDRNDLSGLSQYRNKDHLDWQWQPKSWLDPGLIGSVWHHPEMTAFRRFAILPVLYRVDRTRSGSCIWFTDLRYVIPPLSPAFRYGMCQTTTGSHWRMYRLQRFSEFNREPLG